MSQRREFWIYTRSNVLLQHGVEGGRILQQFNASQDQIESKLAITVQGFDFNKEGLGAEMRAAKGNHGSFEGVVISHAGEL